MIKSKRFLDQSELVENQYIVEYIIMVFIFLIIDSIPLQY